MAWIVNTRQGLLGVRTSGWRQMENDCWAMAMDHKISRGISINLNLIAKFLFGLLLCDLVKADVKWWDFNRRLIFLFLFFFWIKWWYIYFLIVWLLGEGLGFDYVGKIETTLINLLLYIWVYLGFLFIIILFSLTYYGLPNTGIYLDFFFFKKLFGQPYLRMTIVRFFFLVYLLTLRFIIWVEFFVYFCVGTSFILFCVYVCVCKFVSK